MTLYETETETETLESRDPRDETRVSSVSGVHSYEKGERGREKKICKNGNRLQSFKLVLILWATFCPACVFKTMAVSVRKVSCI